MIHNHLFFFLQTFSFVQCYDSLSFYPVKGKTILHLSTNGKAWLLNTVLFLFFTKCYKHEARWNFCMDFSFWYFCIFLMIFQSTFLFSHWDCSRPCQTLSRQSVFQSLMSHFFTSFWEMWSLYIYGKKAFTHAKFIHLFILFYTA